MTVKKMNYNAALYCRVSKDDEKTGESASIATQKKMLKSYAEDQGFSVFGYYIDDGFSGTDFNRPSFIRMTEDIKAGKVNLVITKDLSRLGRDYIVSGQLIEKFFPLYKTRYIAVNDCYDSNNDNTRDLVAIRNVMNELYAGDISRKIRSALMTKMKEGKFVGSFAPYGYSKSEADKNKLIINEDTASIIRAIFRLAANGERPSDIAKYLNLKSILPPSVCRSSNFHGLKTDFNVHSVLWTSGTVRKILKNEVYIGNTVQHKTSKLSFKDKKSIYNSREDYITVTNTHEAIIDKTTFEIVQKQATRRRSALKTDFKNIFSGIALCGSCKARMSASGSGKNSDYRLVCGKYKLYGTHICSNHSIKYNDLYFIITEEIKRYFTIDESVKKQLLKAALYKKNSNNTEEQKIVRLKRRKSELDSIIAKVYEDNCLKKISNIRADSLIEKYENELKLIDFEISESVFHINNSNACGSILSSLESRFEKIDIATVTTLIDCILIFQGEYSGKNKKQSIDIYFKSSY